MKFHFCFLLLLVQFSAYNQIKSDSLRCTENLTFVNHLINTKQFEDAVYVMDHDFKFCNNSDTDTLNYLKGWSFYEMKNRDSAAIYFERVTNKSYSYYKSHFFSALIYSYNQDYEKSKSILNKIACTTPELRELKALELSGIDLLQRDLKSYENDSLLLTKSLYSIKEGELDLQGFYKEQKEFKPKSMLLAGTMSAIIPGAGKIYAGKLGEGLTAFFAISVLSAITIENYRKAGPYNYKTLTSGSLLSVFYLGNIYGSMASIKLYRQEFYKKNEKEILFSLHINLRSFFN